MKKLTIGSAVYDDFDGVYFTYQSLRLNNKHLLDQLDFVIIDNNPTSAQGKATKHFCETTQSIRYFPFTEKTSTSIRNEIFKNAEGEFCMSIDCHVLFEPKTIPMLLDFLATNPESNDLFHGPMLYDRLDDSSMATHMKPEWRDNMYGTWVHSDGADIGKEPFEIPMHGLGVFLTRTNQWLGFNENFSGFGGEEGYIHEKYRQDGRKIWCLPFLRWLHRFDRPAHPSYPNTFEGRIRNYVVGHQELGLPLSDMIAHFKETQPHIDIPSIIQQVNKRPSPLPDYTVPPPPADSAPVVYAWGESKVKFKNPSRFRYLKYELLASYDGYGALQDCRVTPEPVTSPEIVFVSSEADSHSAAGIFKPNESWQSHKNHKGKFPHCLVIDFMQPIEITEINTLARPGFQLGMPTKFKVYVSNDLNQWHEISDVDVFKNEVK